MASVRQTVPLNEAPGTGVSAARTCLLYGQRRQHDNNASVLHDNCADAHAWCLLDQSADQQVDQYEVLYVKKRLIHLCFICKLGFLPLLDGVLSLTTRRFATLA